jgi:hypothetical protein
MHYRGVLDFALFAASVRLRLWLTRNKVAIISSLENCWLVAPFYDNSTNNITEHNLCLRIVFLQHRSR